MPPSPRSATALRALAACALACAGASGVGLVRAQDAILDRMPIDVTVQIVNGTTGEAARAERLLLREPGPIMTTVAERGAVDGEATFLGLMLFNFKPLIATAWIDGVAYHAEQTGQEFLDGKPLTVHGFEQTTDLSGLTITGMNVVVRQRLDGFGVETIVMVENQSRPQRTIAASALPVQIRLPDGLERLEVDVSSSGPDARTAELRPGAGGLQGVAIALPPGGARITVRGQLPEAQRVSLDIGANLAVAAWSLLAWPAELKVHGFDLERDRQHEYPEFSRWIGKPLEAGRTVRVTIDPAPSLAELAPPADAEDPARPAGERPAPRPGFPWRTVVAAVVLLAIYAFWRSRRGRR